MASNQIKTAVEFVKCLRVLNSEMPMQQAHIFLAVALQPGITMAALAKETQLAQSSCSRNVTALSRFKSLGEPGLDLVEAVIDPTEPRRRIIYLTQKGKLELTRMMRAFNPSFSYDRDTDARLEVERQHQEAMQEKSQDTTTGRTKPFKVH